MQKSYQYYADGNLKFVDDVLNGIFDRGQTYDHQGRVVTGKSSTEASGTTVTTGQDTQLPYRQTYGYDAFDHLTSRTNRHWGVESWQDVSNNLTYTYANNRITNSGWDHDADGRATIAAENSGTSGQFYDASGKLFSISNTDLNNNVTGISRTYTGDGREGKRVRSFYNGNTAQWETTDTTYYVRSSVLGGQVISEVGSTGKKTKTFVYAAGTKLAEQSEYTYNSTTTESVVFEHFDASGMSYRRSISNGAGIVGAGNYEGAPGEFDPLGGNAGVETPYVEEPEPLPDPGPLNPNFPMYDDAPMIVNGQQVSCTLDGMSIGCGTAMGLLQGGAAIPAALEPYQHLPGFSFEDRGLGLFSVTLFNVDVLINRPGFEQWVNVSSGTSLYSSNWGVSFTRREPVTTEPPNPPQPPDPGKLKNLEKALDDCTRELFQVKVTSFRPSERGKAGNAAFNFTDPSRRLNGLMGFAVVNDVTSYSIANAPDDVKKQAGKNERVTGFTNSGSPHINYTLSNITNWLDIIKTQVHELGHSLEYIARNEANGNTRYDEAGWKLEDCVRKKGGFKY